jgi:mRNA-degrading endonuclease YafQ of YafQ-DinJ toxin-antitoxin module
MQVALTEGFQRDVLTLDGDQRAAVFESLLILPRAMGAPHEHSGLGLRKIHASGIWEARVGLGLRLVFDLRAGVLRLIRVGTHAEIRRYLRSV